MVDGVVVAVQYFFGGLWDDPMFDRGATQVPTPVGESCFLCQEPVVEGEQGVIRGIVLADETFQRAPSHRECDLRSQAGDVAHLEGHCVCYGKVQSVVEESYRDSARATQEWLRRRRLIALT